MLPLSEHPTTTREHLVLLDANIPIQYKNDTNYLTNPRICFGRISAKAAFRHGDRFPGVRTPRTKLHNRVRGIHSAQF